MKTPITYYGGKQKLAKRIVAMIPEHNLYAEPFFGGGAVFFAKPKEMSAVEVINDTDTDAVNFFRHVQNDFVALEQTIRISLHSRKMHSDAFVMREYPHLFTPLQRAWAFWVLTQQGFAGKISGSWGYDVKKRTTSTKVKNRRESFTEDLAIRLVDVQVECTDALRILMSRDRPDSFFYLDPPYFNSDCGHYNEYKKSDFEELLKELERLQGKFLLSSYPSDVLADYTKRNGWHQIKIEMAVSVNQKSGKPKKKIEVFTANYPIK
ncbi:DNA methyltransferase (plasmid) [Fulvitalea axinellae]|uniref:DNA methyltransferase n=1 Tax=Fulvitalea axinellae TaxID=1182444 RepID=A0AAU9D3K8_9BACT|nr:DNA methyltransferase [Fulvitalea axinellae]